VGWEWDLAYCVGNGGMGTLISAIYCSAMDPSRLTYSSI